MVREADRFACTLCLPIYTVCKCQLIPVHFRMGAGLVNFHRKVFQTKNLGPSAPSLRQGQFWLNDGERSSGYSFYGRKEHGAVASGCLPQEKDSKVNPRTLCGLSQHPISCCPPFLAISHCPVLLITPHSLCGIIPFFKNIFLKLISLF